MMKKLLAFAGIVMFAAGTATAQQSVIKGKIDGYKGDMVMSRVGMKMDTLNLASDGSFELKVDVDKPATEGMVLVRDNVTPMIDFRIGPGERVGFHLRRGTDGVTVEFTGANAALNNFLTEYGIQTDYTRFPQEQMAGMPFREHAALVDAMIDHLQGYLDRVEAGEMRDELQEMLDLTRNQKKFSHTWAVNRVGNRPVDSDPDFVKFAEGLNTNDRRVIGEPYGMVTHAGLIDQRLRWERERNPERYAGENGTQAIFKVIPVFVTDEEVRNTLLNSNMEMYLTMGGDSHLDATFEQYKELSTDAAAVKRLEKQYRELADLGPGKMAPDFAIIDADGNRQMLSDLRGKVLYIDVWATWCGPCVGEIPYVEKLYEKYKGNPNLEFVSISVDDNVEAWKKKLAEDKPGWKNFVVEGGLRGPMNQLYYISGIPRFMLINKDGSIITVNAPRPSSENIEQVLGEYM